MKDANFEMRATHKKRQRVQVSLRETETERRQFTPGIVTKIIWREKHKGQSKCW